MGVRVSFAVQAHPVRRFQAEALAARLAPCDIAYDPDPDHEIPSPWRTYRHALDTTPDWATHRVVIQDDATVPEGVRPCMERAIAARPNRLLVFCVTGNPPHHAVEVLRACDYDIPFIDLPNGFWVSAICNAWPVGMAAELTAFYDEQNWALTAPQFVSDDEIIGRYLTDTKQHALASVPSLAEHDDCTVSLMGADKTAYGGNPYRVAACYVGDCGTCLDELDWNR